MDIWGMDTWGIAGLIFTAVVVWFGVTVLAYLRRTADAAERTAFATERATAVAERAEAAAYARQEESAPPVA